jgi:hypothetical protein
MIVDQQTTTRQHRMPAQHQRFSCARWCSPQCMAGRRADANNAMLLHTQPLSGHQLQCTVTIALPAVFA